eukprot:1365583-Amorphochlora_amoeboformis.AAC.1
MASAAGQIEVEAPEYVANSHCISLVIKLIIQFLKENSLLNTLRTLQCAGCGIDPEAAQPDTLGSL